jgi:putative peptidoglycan lipid II flippase
MRMADLVLANSVQWTGHALVMLWLVNRLAPLRGRGLGPAALKAVAAALLMGVILWSALSPLDTWFPAKNTVTELITVGVLSLVGGSVYLAGLALLRTQELTLLTALLQRFWLKPRS